MSCDMKTFENYSLNMLVLKTIGLKDAPLRFRYSGGCFWSLSTMKYNCGGHLDP